VSCEQIDGCYQEQVAKGEMQAYNVLTRKVKFQLHHTSFHVERCACKDLDSSDMS
jgi:hypothetical protein